MWLLPWKWLSKAAVPVFIWRMGNNQLVILIRLMSSAVISRFDVNELAPVDVELKQTLCWFGSCQCSWGLIFSGSISLSLCPFPYPLISLQPCFSSRLLEDSCLRPPLTSYARLFTSHLAIGRCTRPALQLNFHPSRLSRHFSRTSPLALLCALFVIYDK